MQNTISNTLASLMLAGIIMLAAAATSAQEKTCEISADDMAAFAILDYEAFNYSAEGWRKFSSKGCHYGAGSAIISWLIDNESKLQTAQKHTQHYQAARNFALAERRDVAILQLRLAKTAKQVKQGDMDWNAYLDAFDAWLSADAQALGAAITRLRQQRLDNNARIPNLDAAQRFERCFDKPYLMIEQDASCLAPTAQ